MKKNTAFIVHLSSFIILSALLATGCVGNKAALIDPPESRLPETIEAAGNVAAGAWDRVTGLFGGRE